MEKHWFFTLFARHRVKKAQKRCFFALLRILYKVSRKTWKNTVFTFCGLSRTNLKKTLFSAFYENFVQSVSKDVKKHCFLTLFCRTSRKKLKKCCFSAFLKNFVGTNCLEEHEKTLFSLIFFSECCEKSSKNSVFRIFCELCTK